MMAEGLEGWTASIRGTGKEQLTVNSGDTTTACEGFYYAMMIHGARDHILSAAGTVAVDNTCKRFWQDFVMQQVRHHFVMQQVGVLRGLPLPVVPRSLNAPPPLFCAPLIANHHRTLATVIFCQQLTKPNNNNRTLKLVFYKTIRI